MLAGLPERIARIKAKLRTTTNPRKRYRLKKRLARLRARMMRRSLKAEAKAERNAGYGYAVPLAVIEKSMREKGVREEAAKAEKRANFERATSKRSQSRRVPRHHAAYIDTGMSYGLDAEYLDVGDTYGASMALKEIADTDEDEVGGVEGYLDMIEQYGEDVESEDAMGIVPLIFPLVGLTGYLVGKGAEKAAAKIRYNRHQLVAAMPYLKYRQLRRIARNPFRKRWVRDLALAEMRRRRIRRMQGRPVIIRTVPAGGMITVTRQVPMARIVQFTTRYPKGIIRRRNVIRPRNVVYTTPAQQAAMPQFTNADRRAVERGLPRPVLPVAPRIRSAPVTMPVRPAPRPKVTLPKVPRKAPSVRAIEAELARALRAARNNAAKISAYSTALSKLYAERARTPEATRRFLEADISRYEASLSRLRGSRNVDLLAALGADAAKPTLGDAMLSNPFTTLLLGAAVFGVGALVGKERVIDATLSVTEKITGAAHGAVTSARRRS